jgi:hypothetical protein
MAVNPSDISFSQRLVESIWDSINGSDVEENAYDMHRALDALIVRGKNFHRSDMGGSLMEANVSVKKMGISQQVAEGVDYDLQNVEPLQAATWKWTTNVTPLVFTLEETSENQGKAKIVDTITYKTNEARTDHMDALDMQFFRGTGTYPSTESLNTIIGTSSFGGISTTTYPDWVGHVESASQNLSVAVVDRALDACMFSGTQGIDFIFSGLTLFQRYKTLGATATTLFQPSDAKKTNNVFQGIEMITFRDAVWFWDRKCQDVADPLGLGDTANYLYGVNSAQMFMGSLKGFYQVAIDKKYSPTQLAWHIPLVTRYNFGTTSRRAHFKLSNVTTA